MSEGTPPFVAPTPTSAAPTGVQPPTYFPSETPSAAPSVDAFYFMDGSLVTQLYINEERILDTIEHELFVGIMEEHTESIGDNLTSPFIKTYCTILNQVYGTSGDTIVLQVSYHMNYTTKYGYDVTDYPELFRTYMNENNATTLEQFVDLIDVPDWSYIQEVGTTVSVTDDNSMELITTYAPQTAPQIEGDGSNPTSGIPSDGSIPSSSSSSTQNSNSSDSESASSSVSSRISDTLVGVLLGVSIIILLTVVALFMKVHRKKTQLQHSRDEGVVVMTTNTDDPNEVLECPIDQNVALAAATVETDLDQPPSEEIPPSPPTVREKEIIRSSRDDDNSIINEAIFSFALPIDVSDAEKGIITALDTPKAMMGEGEAHHDRFSSGLSPLSFLIDTESIGDATNGSNHEDVIASLGVPMNSNEYERGTMASSMEMMPIEQQQRGTVTSVEPESISHDLNSSGIGISTVTFAPEVAQTVILEQLYELTIPEEENNSNETREFSPEEVTAPQIDHGIFEGANLMAIRSDSLSTESHDDDSLPSQVSTEDVLDEFDKYRDQLLDVLQEEVESAVNNVHEPLQSAIAQISTDATEQGAAPPLDLSWIGGEDLGSIEASCLCHACAWEQNKDFSTGQSFFDDMLNKIVLIVHHGLLTPHDGARILHGCASIVGLSLVKEVPNNTVVIQGLIITNEVAHGHQLLVGAFEQFGEIVDASIAPQNRSFGFVRFANSESIDKVLNEHRAFTIQDVAVTITTLLR